MTPITRLKRHSRLLGMRYIVVSIFLAGCVSLNPQSPMVEPNIPTPTESSFFRDPTTAVAGTPTPPPSQVQIRPTTVTTSPPTVVALAPTRTINQVATISLYDDILSTDWAIDHSDHVKYEVASTAFVHSGEKAIAVTPIDDFGRIFLTVRKDARKVYPRDRILGIRFWISGGENTIGTSDLAVTVTGSNQYTYWASGDTSVKIDAPVTVESPLFPETRLYYLHINRSIPPNTWAEVIVWLDDLIDDPPYTNVTGMYIKNDQGFLDTYYVDDIQILVQNEE